MERIPILSRALDAVQAVALAVGILMMVAMAVLMNTEIASRTLFGFSTQVSDEFAGYFFTVSTLLCFLPALRGGRFLAVEGFVVQLPMRARALCEIGAAAVGAVVCAVLTSATYDLAAASYAFGTQSLQASETPLFLPQAIMPVGFGLLAVAFLERGVIRAVGLWRGKPPESEANYAVD